MLLTPRAQLLKPRVHSVVAEAWQTLEPDRPFVARELSRTFVVHLTDYVLTVLGHVVDRILCEEAPEVCIRFVPNSSDDPAILRDGGADMAVGIYGDLPQEMRTRQLLTDRFVCAVAKNHKTVRARLSLVQFARLAHIQVAPRGKPGGYLDDMLRERGLVRRVARAVPFFVSALQMAAATDYVVTAPERITTQLAPALGLRILEAPLVLRPYALSLVWHPRFDGDAGHRFLREVFLKAAREAAGNRHQQARARLDPTDLNSGQTRKRLRTSKQRS